MTLAQCHASPAEKARPLPGDSIVPASTFTVTHAITIQAPTDRVWPWLAQMGGGRGGWYSWDRIDNGAQRSAEAILSEYQAIAPGDIMPAIPGARDAFVVTAVDPDRDLILAVPDPHGDVGVTWEHYLEPLPGQRTRLMVRSRVSPRWLDQAGTGEPASGHPVLIECVYKLLAALPRPLMVGAALFGHRIMEARHLRGIKRRAESGLGVGRRPLRDPATRRVPP